MTRALYTPDSIIAGNRPVLFVDTVADLDDADIRYLTISRGYYADGDGGGGPVREYVDSGTPGTYTDNGGSIIVPSGEDGSGAWLFTGSEPLNARSFGAKGDGATDDSTALQAAIDASYGYTLYIPHGTYAVETELDIDGTTLGAQSGTMRVIGDGMGTTLTNTGASNRILQIHGSTSNRAYLDIEGIQFLAGNSATSDALVLVDLVSDWSFKNCEFRGAVSGAIAAVADKLLHLKGSQHSNIQCCAFTNGNYSVYMERGTGNIIKPNENVFISNNFVAAFTEHVHIEYCAQLLMIGNTFNVAPVCINMTQDGGGFIDIAYNHFEEYTDAAIRSSVGGVNVQSNRFPTTEVAAYDIDFTAGTAHRVIGNELFRNVRVNAVCQDFTFNNNYIQSTCTVAIAATINYQGTGNTDADGDSVGTFTPALTISTVGDLSITYATQLGRYQRVGNRCRGTIDILTSGFTHTTASGALRITGLPFSCSASNTAHGGSASIWQGFTKADYTQLGLRGRSGRKEYNLFLSGSAQNTAQVTEADVPTGGTIIVRTTFDYEIKSGE